MTSLAERYVASMVLSGVGDAMGFKNGGWEFCMSGRKIHDDMEKLGGIKNLCIKRPKWKVSDDTVMQLATGDALVEYGNGTDKEVLYQKTAFYYKNCMSDMTGRSAGMTCSNSCWKLRPSQPEGYQLPFDPRGGGCGAAMRAMCIGLRYPGEEVVDDLIAYSVESGRMTHHHPTGYLGSLAAALFVSYSIQGKPVHEWGAGLVSILPKALQYVESQGRYVAENKEAWSYFENAWVNYLKERGISDGKSDPKFPKRYDVEERDAFYKYLSFAGWGGASGHDAPMIAYDALLGAGDSWEELCKRGMLHGGDNDSTGVIAGACFGAMYGYKGVSKNNYKNLEYRKRLTEMGTNLYKLSHPDLEVEASLVEDCDLALVEEEKEWAAGEEARAEAAQRSAMLRAAEAKEHAESDSKVKFSGEVEAIEEPAEAGSTAELSEDVQSIEKESGSPGKTESESTGELAAGIESTEEKTKSDSTLELPADVESAGEEAESDSTAESTGAKQSI